MSRIHGKVYLGTYVEASDKNWIKEHKITHILITAQEIDPHFEQQKKLHYKKMSMMLVDTFNPIPCFDEAADHMNLCQKDKECKG